MRGRGRGRGRGARGRRGGISRGRGKKNVKIIESDEEEAQGRKSDDESGENAATSQTASQDSQELLSGDKNTEQSAQTQDENFPPKIDLEADISQLEAPTFTTINRGPPEPMLHLRWDHKVSLIGEKVLNPMIHSCDQCNKPILIYGRMIPCKHVFCLSCARKEDKACPRCMDPVSRVEQTNLGTVFMCTHGGSRYGRTGCRRTYLSQRDLQAHINHRHSVSGGDASPKVSGVSPQPPPPQQPPPPLPRKILPTNAPQSDPRTEGLAGSYRLQSRTNLITVPIQQEPPPPPQPQPPPSSYHPQGGVAGGGGYPAPPPPPPPPVQYGGGYPSSYYQTPPPPGSYPPPPPPPQFPPTEQPPPPPPQQYWAHPPPIHQFYR